MMVAKNKLVSTANAVRSYESTIEVFGLGYVGFPLAVRLAGAGMNVRGIDVNPDRIARLEQGKLLDTERSLEGSFLAARKSGKLLLDTSPNVSPIGKIGVICVPTPIPSESTLSSTHVNAAVNSFLETSQGGEVLIVESSVEVGTTDQARQMIERSGYQVGVDFGLAFCPERIDPQNTKWTLENIPRIIYCSDDTTYKIAKNIYSHVNNSNLVRVSTAKTAEVTKSFENAFRLVNISLVNELAILCDQIGINVREVIDSAATKPFGFMPFYPGAGAGGHCVPKDPIFLSESARKGGNEFITIANALRINAHMPKYISRTMDGIRSENNLSRSVLICGMSYKPNIEDMRDSPGFKLVREFSKMEYMVGVYDPFLNPELLPKYKKENFMSDEKFDIVDSIEAAGSKFSCLCICQYHSNIAPLLQDVYSRGLFSVVYDCQNKIRYNKKTRSILRTLGYHETAG